MFQCSFVAINCCTWWSAVVTINCTSSLCHLLTVMKGVCCQMIFWKLQATSVWVMLRMRVKVHSPTPPPRAIAVRDVSLSQLAPHIHQFANCHRARPASAVRYRTWVNWYLLIASATALPGWPAVFHTAISVGPWDGRSASWVNCLMA